MYDLDLLHVHYAIPHSVSALLARQMLAWGPSIAASAFCDHAARNRHHAGRSDPSYLPVTRFSIEQSDGVTAISQYLRERTLREFGIQNNINVIYNFVNCELYCRDQGKDC